MSGFMRMPYYYVDSDTTKSQELRLKVGDALLQIIVRCGDITAKYASALMPGILQVSLK
jgi:hypothetical protein